MNSKFRFAWIVAALVICTALILPAVSFGQQSALPQDAARAVKDQKVDAKPEEGKSRRDRSQPRRRRLRKR